jgi:hypothetical protein
MLCHARDSRFCVGLDGRAAEPEHRVSYSQQRIREPIFDTYSDDLDGANIFDEEPFFEDELVYDEEAAGFTTTCSAIFNIGPPVDDVTLFDEEPVHSAEYTVEQEPVFDKEDKGHAFDIEPISDRLGVDDFSTARIGDFHPNTNMVDLDTTCSSAALFPPFSTSTIIDEYVLFPGRTTALLSTPDIKQSDSTVDTPAKFSTKCLSNHIDIMIFLQIRVIQLFVSIYLQYIAVVANSYLLLICV